MKNSTRFIHANCQYERVLEKVEIREIRKRTIFPMTSTSF